LLDHHFHIAAR